MTTIKNWKTQEIIYTSDKETIREAVEEAISKNINLSGSDLSATDLSKSNLSGSDLSATDLSKSNLSGSDLSGSNLYNADLSRSNLSGTDLYGATIDEDVDLRKLLNIR